MAGSRHPRHAVILSEAARCRRAAKSKDPENARHTSKARTSSTRNLPLLLRRSSLLPGESRLPPGESPAPQRDRPCLQGESPSPPGRSSLLLGNPTLQGRALRAREKKGALAPGVARISHNSQIHHSKLNGTRCRHNPQPNTAQHPRQKNPVKPPPTLTPTKHNENPPGNNSTPLAIMDIETKKSPSGSITASLRFLLIQTFYFQYFARKFFVLNILRITPFGINNLATKGGGG